MRDLPGPDAPAMAPRRRCSVPADVLYEVGTVLLDEPADADADALRDLLATGAYGKPYVVDDGVVRRLFFSPSYVQSEMTIARPHELNFAYTRKMMGFLLFVPRPKHVVIVGLGGGSLTRYCHRHLPRARLTTVEIDPRVIAFGDLFAVPAPDARHRLIEGDAVDYFAGAGRAGAGERADVVLLDGCDAHGIAPAFGNAGFYEAVRARLRAGGVLVVNLVGAAAALRDTIAQLQTVFQGRVIVQNVGEGGTKVAYAFQDAAFVPDWDRILREATALTRRHGLDFAALARKLRRSGFSGARAAR